LAYHHHETKVALNKFNCDEALDEQTVDEYASFLQIITRLPFQLEGMVRYT